MLSVRCGQNNILGNSSRTLLIILVISGGKKIEGRGVGTKIVQNTNKKRWKEKMWMNLPGIQEKKSKWIPRDHLPKASVAEQDENEALLLRQPAYSS